MFQVVEFFAGIKRLYPVKDIRDYYGEKIALYFVFLQHLLHPLYGLPVPALLGCGVYALHSVLEVEATHTARVTVDLLYASSVAIFGTANSRNPRHLDTIEGGRVYQALHIESKSVLDAPYRLKKCLGRPM